MTNDQEYSEGEYGEMIDSNAGKPKPKVVGATVGAGVGSALATVIAWIVSLTAGVEVPESVELATGVVLTAGLAFICGWFTRE